MKHIKNLHEKAGMLLELANDMQIRINALKEVDELMQGWTKPNDDRIDTCERGKRRLIESYKKVLIEILAQ